MTILMAGLAAWLTLMVLALVLVAALCRSGHEEDLQRGYL